MPSPGKDPSDTPPFDDGSIVPDPRQDANLLDASGGSTDIGVGRSAVGASERPIASSTMMGRRPVAIAAGLVAAVLLTLLGISLFGTSGDDTVEPAQAAREGQATEDQTASGSSRPDSPSTDADGEAGSSGSAGQILSGGGDPNFPPGDDHLAADAIGYAFQNDINGENSYAVAYLSQRGLQILSARGASAPEIEVAVGFNEAARFPLFSDGNETWAINSRTPDLAYLVSTQFVVVDVGLEGSVAFINNSLDPINVGISSFGAWGPGFNVPQDADIHAIPGRGILIAPATGGSFRLGQLGVEKISDDRVVAAGLNSQVFQRCDDRLFCELYATSRAFPDEFVLDVSPTATVFISPEGRHAVTVDNGESKVTSIGTGESWLLGLMNPAQAAGWSPDGEFVTIIDGEEMVFAFVDGRETRVTMPVLPSSNALLVLDS